MRKQEIDAVILGWCSYQQGGRVQAVRPEGLQTGGEGDGWDEEQWCFWRVEEAIVKYVEAFSKLDPTYGRRASKQVREWLTELFWDSIQFDKYGDWAAMVAMEVHQFRRLLRIEVEKNPRVRVFKGVGGYAPSWDEEGKALPTIRTGGGEKL